MSYPRIIKEAALEKMFHTDLSLRHIADELGIPRATLHGWKRQYQMIKNDSETVTTSAESWTPEEKFAVVLESAALSEVELNAYCREKGLYPGQIKSWREACIRGNQPQDKYLRREANYQPPEFCHTGYKDSQCKKAYYLKSILCIDHFLFTGCRNRHYINCGRWF